MNGHEQKEVDAGSMEVGQELKGLDCEDKEEEQWTHGMKWA